MSDFAEYVAALFHHWEPLIGAMLIFIAAFLPRVQNFLDEHPKRRKLWVWLILICAFLATFFAWKDEHNRYMSAVFRLDVPTVTIEGGTTYKVLPDDYLLSVASVPEKKTTLILPPNPHRGQRFEIKDANGAISLAFPIVVDGNGNKIDQTNTFDMKMPDQAIVLTYNGIKWIVT
jgi:hypothetical protein